MGKAGAVSKPGADGNKADPMARAVHGDAPMSEARTGGDTSKSKEELERALRAVKEEIKKLRESQGAVKKSHGATAQAQGATATGE